MDNTSSKFHRIIKLRQDTPMWHFQSEQNGCCLRASEVKPKLDRFLAEKENKEYTSLGILCLPQFWYASRQRLWIFLS